MGQYYNALVKINNVKEEYYHQVDGEYEGAKLMEHSYYGNSFVLAIASKFWRTKGQLAWVGDYAEPSDFNWNEEFEGTHNEKSREDLIYNGFRLEGKLFINHTKKMIIDLDEYKELASVNEWGIISPISLLTAVGNDKGGGDFHKGKGFELVGTWAWDEIEITDRFREIYDYHYNYETKEYDKSFKPEFNEYVDVTKDYIFIEG